ncbi:MAG: type III-B CRISPR module-associated protein Cmr3 [Defluviitoga tunisiensis]|nr:type III-B CRISPR module-associated protein Cmr3 [Defluviitoga tunisiensis]HPZ66929.1 type III-B CRISPR module-associated protein Cmr3 [Defluviitoga tunisiensis]HQD43758.1 type III-B CRISPR module-associated protein Cmr3 [Defluviitoga tunisiensis]
MLIQISPMDNVYFGKGLSFDAGFDNLGVSVFPPPPSFFYGAISTYYLSTNGLNSENIKRVKDKIKIKGIYYSISSQFYALAPLDFVKIKDPIKYEREKRLIPLELCSPIVSSNMPENLTNLLYSKYQVENVNALIDDTTMSEVLIGKKDKITFINLNSYVKEESKIGIKIDAKSRTSQQGYLYKINYINLARTIEEKLDFVVDVEVGDLLFPDIGLLKLGGEGKAAEIKQIEDQPDFLNEEVIAKVKEEIDKSKRFKLILNTPAIFNEGWKPDITKLGVQAELIGAAVGKPTSIGGWDMESNSAKPMFKAAPSGSVYYYELKNSSVDDLFNNNCLSISDQRTNEGFGAFLIGRW